MYSNETSVKNYEKLVKKIVKRKSCQKVVKSFQRVLKHCQKVVEKLSERCQINLN
jgi:hypothetical protein